MHQRTVSGLLSSLAALALCLAAPVQATDLALREASDMAGMSMFLNAGAPALILVVVRGDESVILPYGETALGNRAEPDAHSIFRLGSVSKVFATDLLATMAADGQLHLTDPLARFAPDGITVKSVDGEPVSLLDLATHSAGLPRELGDPSVQQKDTDNPFLRFRRDYYWHWMATQGPSYRPGTHAIYSNLGFGLLGDALAKAGGKPYADLVHARITAPLAMSDTAFRLSDQQKPRLMVGLDPFGKPDPNWQAPDIMDASAGIYSTADDMARWMRWHLQPTEQSKATLALVNALWRPNDGLDGAVGVEATSSAGMGLGWVVSPANGGVPFLLGKSGGLGGFMTYVVLSPNRHLGIFVVATRVNFAMFEMIHSSVRELAAELAPAR